MFLFVIMHYRFNLIFVVIIKCFLSFFLPSSCALVHDLGYFLKFIVPAERQSEIPVHIFLELPSIILFLGLHVVCA